MKHGNLSDLLGAPAYVQNGGGRPFILGDSLFTTFDRLRCGIIIMDQHGNICASNQTAHELIGEKGLSGSDRDDSLRDQIKKLLRHRSTRFRFDDESWLIIDRPDKRPVAIRSIPAGGDEDRYDTSVLMIVDLNFYPQPSPEILQRMFKLSPAEAQLALALSRGESLSTISESKGVTLKTVRTQLAAIFQKTQTSRQAELVALLARVSVLS